MTDIFDCRTMLDAVEQMVRPRTFLRDLFFNGANPVTFGTTAVDIDIVKGTRKMAPFVHPRLPGACRCAPATGAPPTSRRTSSPSVRPPRS